MNNWNGFRSNLLDSPLYIVWASMKGRCQNSNLVSYVNYGGRGIRVCNRWQNYKNFETDMLSGYKKGLTLERIDNNGNYEPSNCRWATREDQSNNTRRSKYITINNITKTLAQWIKESTIKSSTVRQRYYVYGWTIEKSLEKRG